MPSSDQTARALAVSEHEQEFLKELRLMSKLRHPNVVEFVGAVATPGQLAIVCVHKPHLSRIFSNNNTYRSVQNIYH